MPATQPIYPKVDSNYHSAAGDAGAIETLRSRLSSGANVLKYGDKQWVERLKCYSPQGEQVPAYIVECATEDDVKEAVIFATSLNLPVVARNGAHNLGEFSNAHGGVVISQSPRTGVRHDEGAGTVTFEGGTKFSDVDEYLWKNLPGWAMQSAMIASIGTTGSHFAVGVGWLQRLVGNGIDNIVSVRVVLADGSVAIASESENPDLLYALKGAAPSFGIVTEVTEKIHHIVDPDQGKEVRHAQYFFDLDHAERVLGKIREWNDDETFPDEAFLLPIVMYANGKKGVMFWYTQYMYDTEAKTIRTETTRWETEIRELARELNAMPLNHFAPEGAADHDGWESITHMQLQGLFAPPWIASYYPTGGFVAQSNAEKVMQQVIDYWRKPGPDGAEDVPFHSTAFYHFGGKRQRARSPSAWPGNEQTNYLCATWGGWLTAQEDMQRAQRKAQTMQWVDGMFKDLRRDLQWGYICAAAYNWRSVNHAKWIHGDSFEQLTVTKAKFDAKNVFRNNVNIPPKADVSAPQSIKGGVQEAWDNHFSAFGAQDIDRILLDYSEQSVMCVFDHTTGQKSTFEGLKSVRACFEALFSKLKSTDDLTAPVIDVEERDGGGSVFLIWSCPSSGFLSVTDTFLFDGNAKVLKQNVVMTTKPSNSNSGLLRRFLAPAAIQHIGVNVDDMAMSKRFYSEILGGTFVAEIDGIVGEEWTTILNGDALAKGKNAPDLKNGDALHVCFYSFGNTAVELLRYYNVASGETFKATSVGAMEQGVAGMHICFNLADGADPKEFISALTEASVDMPNVSINKPDLFHLGPDGDLGGWSLAFMSGPNGERIEFVQVPPGCNAAKTFAAASVQFLG